MLDHYRNASLFDLVMLCVSLPGVCGQPRSINLSFIISDFEAKKVRSQELDRTPDMVNLA